MVAVLSALFSVVPSARTTPAAAATPTLDISAIAEFPDPWSSGHAGLYGWGAATLPDGSVLIGDYWNHRVQHYASDGTLLDANFIHDPGYGADQHQSPYGLGVDPVNGDVYMADTDRRGIDRYTSSGTFITSFGSQGTGAGKFLYPSRVAVSDERHVFVADTWDNLISVHQPNGSELSSFGGFGTADGKFKQPHGIAFDYGADRTTESDDRLYVVDTNNHRVQIFETDGTFVKAFGSKGSAEGQFIGDMRGLAIDQANGWVYVVDAAGNRVDKFDLDGQFLDRWGTEGEGPGQFSDGGREVTVDGNGNVWVGDMPNFRAQVFSPGGTFIREVPSPAEPPPDTGFNGPRGVAVDAAGNMFVTDTYNQRIVKMAPDGTTLLTWGSRGRGDYSFNYPRMVATDPNDGSVVVADTDNHRIRKYTNDGVHVWSVGGRGTAPGLFKNPHAVDVGPDGRIYVGDTNNDRVQVLGPDGSPLYGFGSTGTGTGKFMRPRGLALDAATGDIYVADSIRDDVQRFSNTGAYLGTVATKGTTDSTLANPFDVEVDNGYVFVADTSKNKVKVFTTGGSFVTAFGGWGTKLGKMISPEGLDIHDGKLYVAEMSTAGTDRERVQVFQLYGPPPPPGDPPALERVIGGPGHATMYPSGMEVAPDGSIVVADTGNSEVAVYETNGALRWRIGGYGPGNGRFKHPRDVGVDVAGNIYVADSANTRVVKLDPTGAWVTSWKGPSGNTMGTPMGITVTGGKVYVADAGKKRVRVFDTSGTLIRDFGSSGPCSLAALRDADADAAGNIYVANYTNNDIVKFSSTGACLTTWGTKGTGPGEFKNPYGVRVATDPVLGSQAVFVADSNNNRIQEFTTAGVHVATIGAGSFDSLRRVAVAGDGDVWGADLWGFKAVRLDRTAGGYTPAQTLGGQAPQATDTEVFNQVRGVTTDAAGQVYGIDTINQRVVRFSATGELQAACGQRGWATGSFNWPQGAAIDDATGEIWVADTKQSRLQVMTPNCIGLEKFGKYGTSLTSFSWPMSIAIRGTDRIAVVADTNNSRIVAYDVASRTPIATFGSKGGGNGQFNRPKGIDVDPVSGHLFVADTNNHRVVELSLTTSGSFGWVRTLTDGFSKPEGVASDDQGRVFVADTGNDRMVVLASDGTVDAVVTGDGQGLDQPADVAVGPDGRVYVTDTLGDRILVYAYPGAPPPPPPPPVGLTYLRDFAGPGLADMYPVDVAATDDHYYVVDPGRYRVVAVNRTTGAIDASVGGHKGTTRGTLSAARAIALDSQGRVYVADSANSRVQRFSSTLQFQTTWGKPGTGAGQFGLVYGIAVGDGLDATGSPAEVVYTTDGDRVQKFTLDGTFISQFGSGLLNQPRQLTVEPVSHDLYVLSARDREVVVFGQDGIEKDRFGSEGSNDGQFRGDPRGIAISGNEVFVSDDGNRRIQVFGLDGTYLRQFANIGPAGQQVIDPRGLSVASDGTVVVTDEWAYALKEYDGVTGAFLVPQRFGTPPPLGGVDTPRGIDVNAAGQVFVTDWWNQRIQRYEANGTAPFAWGFRGTSNEDGSINFAWDVAVQPTTGRVFVANRESHEVEVFTPDGGFVTRWGNRGSGNGEFLFPQGLAFDPTDGSLLVSDSKNGRVQRFSVSASGDGTWLASYGSTGSGPQQLDIPTGVAVESDGTVWIADSGNSRIQRISPSGTTWTSFAAPTGGTAFKRPWGVSVAPDGSIWVADTGNDRIVQMDADGAQLLAADGPALGAGAMDDPFDVAFLPSGHVLVSDAWNNRVIELG